MEPGRIQRERERWNQKYEQGGKARSRPDPFFAAAWEDFVSPLFPRAGVALDLAGGTGRHAVWLARAGWQVTLADISDVAIAGAKRRAGACRPLIRFERQAAHEAVKGSARFDLILVFYYLERNLFPALVRALRPGGLLMYKTFTALQRSFGEGPRDAAHLLRRNELLRAFSSLQVLYYQETVRERAVAEFVGRKAARK